MLIGSLAIAQTKTPTNAASTSTTTTKPTNKGGKGKKDKNTKSEMPKEQFVTVQPSDDEVETKLIREMASSEYQKNPKFKKTNDSLRAILRERRKHFYVKTKYPTRPTDKIQLAYNLVYNDTNIMHFVNDSICKDPEVAKVLFEKLVGDTNYVLIYVDAYSKSKSDGGRCNAGKETKITFVRWNVKTQASKWKHRTISSCLKTITNMTKTSIADWDKSSELIMNYHRGANFYDIKFDPAKPQLGLQSSSTDNEAK